MVSSISTSLLTVVGVITVGYCYYFDCKRRNHPNYRQNVRANRLKKREAINAAKAAAANSRTPARPDFDRSDPEAVQRFFMEQMKLGQELMNKGDVESAITQIAIGVREHTQPQEILVFLQQSLHPMVFQMLLAELDPAGFAAAAAAQEGGAPPTQDLD